MARRPRPHAHDLLQLRERIENLRRQGMAPIEVVMSPETWERMKRQYRGTLTGLSPKVISCRDVLGVRNKLVPGVQGCVVRYFGGADIPPDQALEDGFIDLAALKIGRDATDRSG